MRLRPLTALAWRTIMRAGREAIAIMLGAAAVWDAVTGICLVIITLCIVATAAGILFVVFKAKSLLVKVSGQIKPIAERGQRILETAERTVDSTGERVQSIAQRSDETVGFVTERIRSATTLISELISHPLISAAALAAGVRRVIETLTSQSDQTTSQH